jgi:hypothetical protein
MRRLDLEAVREDGKETGEGGRIHQCEKEFKTLSRSVIISMLLLRMQTCLVKSGQNVRRGCLNDSQRKSESPTVGE